MTKNDTQRAKSIFLAAIDRQQHEWPAYLDEACGDDAQLRSQVEQLLKAHQDMGSFHEAPDVQPTVIGPVSESVGDQIGPYKLREQLGEGGFGVVYVAEQTQPVRRKVALKVIKPGMDTREVIARFEAERQALALMDHPNIAKVLDAGTTDSGRPFFAMELVHGVSVTEYCDKNKLPTADRLKLFIDVCHAVHHAHQKGVIHRDLKPSNIMVTLHDGKPVAKVIDFGVSKALSQQLTEKSIYTAYGQIIGTPVYMSPEQAEMSGLGIDTRSDIYSLGVLLYELLTGTTPLESERLRTAGYNEMLRLIREEEPIRPSLKVSSLGEKATVIANHRRTDSRTLSHSLKGELDWIVMTALEKDRERRYDTANSFAADVQRFLNDEAVAACPPSQGYRIRKFLRRNRTVATVVVAISVALLAGVIGTTWGLIKARQANYEITETNRQLVDANREIVRFLLDQAFVAALSAEEATTANLVDKLVLSGATEAEIELAWGLLNRSLNNAEDAHQHFLRATELDPTSVAAWSALAEYCFVLQLPEYRTILEKASQLPRETYLDHLLFGSANGVSGVGGAGKGIPHIEESIRMHDTALARIQLALLLAIRAGATNDPEEMLKARENLAIGRSMTGFPYFTALAQTWVFHSAVLLAWRSGVSESELAPLLAAAREGAAKVHADLLEKRGSALIHWTCANHFEWFEPDTERAAFHWKRLLSEPDRFEGYYTGFVLRDHGIKAALQLLEGKSNRMALSHRAILLALTPGGSAEAWQIWTDHLKPETLIVPVLLGRMDVARDACTSESSKSNRYAIGDVSEAKFLDEKADDGGHYMIGFKALAPPDPDREKARHHFEQCVRRGTYMGFHKSLSAGFLAEMNRDPLWPRPAERK